MKNTTNLKKRRSLFENLARLFFTLYMITLYVFVGRVETVAISRIIFLLYAGFTVLVLLQRKRIHIGKNVLTGYITITWMYATTFWAYNEYWASYKMNTVWLVFLLFFLTYNLFSEEDDAHEYLLKNLYISGISLLAYSIYTYGFSQVIDMMTQPGGVRLGREISQENTFGMCNATTVLVAFYYLICKKRFKLFHLVIIATSFLFSMSSGSRKALLMMCIGVLFLVYQKYGIKKIYKVVAVTTIIIIIFMLVIRLPMFEHTRYRFEQATNIVSGAGKVDDSAEARMSMIQAGWRIFKGRLLIGYGADNFGIVSGYHGYSHNNFIEILVDFGLIGFVLYYSTYAIALGILSRSKKEASKILLCIFLVRLLMEVALVTYYDKIHWLLLAFFLISENKGYFPEEISDDENIEEIEKPFGRKEVFENSKEACKEGVFHYETEESFEEIRQGNFESETFYAGDSGKGNLCTALFGQDISETEVLGDNGQEAQP